jgi:hypothetical protein
VIEGSSATAKTYGHALRPRVTASSTWRGDDSRLTALLAIHRSRSCRLMEWCQICSEVSRSTSRRSQAPGHDGSSAVRAGKPRSGA